jgi:hypothetical protein
MIIQASGISITAICNRSGVSRTAIRRWRDGTTIAGTTSAVRKVLEACGFEFPAPRRRE